MIRYIAMEELKTIFFAFIFYFMCLSNVFCDVLYLKNGRSLEGLVREENAGHVELDVGFGTVTFEKGAIERLTKSSPDEIGMILKRWETERIKSEQMRAKAEEEWNKQLVEWKERKRNLEKEREARPKEVAMRKDSGHLMVDAVLNKRYDVSLLVDTGASLIVLTPAAAKELRIDISKDGTPIQLLTASGQKTDARYVVLESVKISDVTAENVEAAVLLDEKQDYGFKDGLLGMSFLRRFNFRFDYDKNKLILEKLKQ